jgi:hypothetical protein
MRADESSRIVVARPVVGIAHAACKGGNKSKGAAGYAGEVVKMAGVWHVSGRLEGAKPVVGVAHTACSAKLTAKVQQDMPGQR